MTRYAIPSTVCGVYHLIAGDRVMYVGQSANVLHRIGAWAGASAGKFDAWDFYPCAASELNDLEREHIERFDPPMNRAGRECYYAGVRRGPVPRCLIEYGSWEAYFDSLPALIGGGQIRRCGISLNNDGLLALPGFPAPAAFGRWPLWRRDEVRQWLIELDAEREASAA